MPATSFTKTWDALATTTLDNYRKKLRDNIFVGVPFLDWLFRNGRIRTVPGGIDLIEHLLYEANSTARSFRGYDPIDLTPQEGKTIAKYEPREYDVSIIISRRERNQNRGSMEQLINLLKARIRQSEKSLRDLMATDLFAAQAGDALDGLQTLVSDAAATVGEVAEATNAWWAPQRDTTAISTIANYRIGLRNIYNDCTVGTDDQPNLIVSEQDTHEAYEADLEVEARWELSKDNSGLGFGVTALAFRGKPYIWDLKCPTNKVYILNSEHLQLQVYEGSNFSPGPMITPHDQHASASSIYFMGALTTDERRKLGVMTNVNL
jgi:hypothetical protein